MWPVRTRRGTRKRCAALFVVGLCAAVMVLTRPFITTQMVQQFTDDIVVVLPPASQFLSGGGRTGVDLVNDTSVVSFQDMDAIATLQDNSSIVNKVVTSGGDDRGAPPAAPAEGAAAGVLLIMDPAVEPLKNKSLVRGSEQNSRPATSSPLGPPTTTGFAVSSTPMEVVTSSISTSPSSTISATTSSSQSKSSSSPVTTTTVKDVPFAQLPTIYVITPTFPRMEQIPELTRLGQTLMHVRKLVWIVADDASRKSPDVETLLAQMRIKSTYILGAMPDTYRKRKGNKPKGVANRMAGIQWIRKNADSNGVMFFADDDNSYDIRLFEEMRWTKVVSMWPVGLVTQLGVSTPVVRDGKIVDFYDGWIASRKFPVDMAGFAINVGFLRSRPKAAMPFRAGFEEDGFLRSLNITLSDLEPKAENCTKIYVWHTRTVSNKVPQKMSANDRQKFNHTNLFHLPYIV